MMKLRSWRFAIADAKIFLILGRDGFDKRFFVCENEIMGMYFFKSKLKIPANFYEQRTC